MGIAFDVQANGWADDGTESGVVRTRAFGDLVKVPWRCLQYSTSGTAYYGESASDNSDGSNASILLSQAAGLPGVQQYIRFAFRGTVLGVRFDPYYNSPNLYDFGVTIDAVPYRVPKAYPLIWDGTAYNVDHGDYAAIVASDLPDGNHIGEITLAAYAAAANKNQVHGLLLERRAGYEPLTRLALINTPAAVPTALTYVVANAMGIYRAPRGFRQVFYANTSASPVTVTVQYNGVTAWSKSIAAGDTQACDFGIPISLDPTSSSLLKHMASASGVNFSVVGVV